MPLPSLYFLAFEILVLVLFLACLQNAWQRGSSVAWQLFAGVLFGLLLEWATIQQLDAYKYGSFLVMLGPVPVVVGMAWGTIIYSVRSFSDKTSLPEWARPVLDGLMGLNMDLSMDAIAIRLGMWNWGKGFDYQYFGVPYNNFWAWFWVVFSFSASLRLLSKLPGIWGRWFSPAGAIICGTTGVLITNELITNIPNGLIHYTTILAVLGSALLLILALRPEISIRSQAAFVFLVPLGFHAYFLIAGLVSNVILGPPFLLVVSIVMSIIALGLHRDALNYWYRSNRESKTEKAGN
ncbi:carotenoid biosynthesis protein [Methanosarcina sp.]|uniref:carotenoid biosynthesis protein n=1 Tax=Methanosarcina sp. TaxID=2213 RepID=UPI00298992A5|nr:carotenoid biosynthesis protein [Methanosarcina sp.]MDW5551016.1 carotenoid biosynthesis protein [Methanosarcina sp.]MDW5555400.1 carotenoid biosynthesis protein [Methanosarcina sp.]MDW5561028.1 carotenoid biosynthesis protein [Methanosarcina sp.]